MISEEDEDDEEAQEKFHINPLALLPIHNTNNTSITIRKSMAIALKALTNSNVHYVKKDFV